MQFEAFTGLPAALYTGPMWITYLSGITFKKRVDSPSVSLVDLQDFVEMQIFVAKSKSNIFNWEN